MKIKIIKCGSPMLWYYRHVGKTFRLLREDDEGYWTRQPEGYLNVVRKQDAEIIENDIQAN